MLPPCSWYYTPQVYGKLSAGNSTRPTHKLAICSMSCAKRCSLLPLLIWQLTHSICRRRQFPIWRGGSRSSTWIIKKSSMRSVLSEHRNADFVYSFRRKISRLKGLRLDLERDRLGQAPSVKAPSAWRYQWKWKLPQSLKLSQMLLRILYTTSWQAKPLTRKRYSCNRVLALTLTVFLLPGQAISVFGLWCTMCGPWWVWWFALWWRIWWRFWLFTCSKRFGISLTR